MVARFALIDMFAQCRCPTQRQFRQSALYMRRSLRRPTANKLACVLLQDIGDSGFLSCGGVSSFCRYLGTCLTGSQSTGLGVDCR